MHTPPDALLRHLEQLSMEAAPGEQLPTIRELMKRFGASQARVQRAFQDLKDRGVIASQVGRGTYFLKSADRSDPLAFAGSDAPRLDTNAKSMAPADRPAATRSVLLLRRSVSVARGRLLVEGLQQRFAAGGHQVLEVAYNDPVHALTVLKGLPRFDACVVQSTFRTIPVALVAALRAKTGVVAVDGVSLAGADVDAVGTEWGEALATAVRLLRDQNHRRIAFAITAHPLLSVQLARRRLTHLARDWPELKLSEIALPLLPDEPYATTLAERLAQLQAQDGALPFTALVAWGIEDSAGWKNRLEEQGLSIPGHLSVVLLARPDLPNEHAHFFHVVGASIESQVEALHEAVSQRWDAPSAPFGVRLTPIQTRLGRSVALPRAEAAAP